jgi:hypothetical protein
MAGNTYSPSELIRNLFGTPSEMHRQNPMKIRYFCDEELKKNRREIKPFPNLY